MFFFYAILRHFVFAKVSEVRMCVWSKSNLDASGGEKELVKNFNISSCHQHKCTTFKEWKLEILFCFIAIFHIIRFPFNMWQLSFQDNDITGKMCISCNWTAPIYSAHLSQTKFNPKCK